MEEERRARVRQEQEGEMPDLADILHYFSAVKYCAIIEIGRHV
jgi:hypothetical protein